MALHKNFPKSPHVILNPDIRWFPADEVLRGSSYDKLLLINQHFINNGNIVFGFLVFVTWLSLPTPGRLIKRYSFYL